MPRKHTTKDEIKFLKTMGTHVPRFQKLSPEAQRTRRLELLREYLNTASKKQWPDGVDEVEVLEAVREMIRKIEGGTTEGDTARGLYYKCTICSYQSERVYWFAEASKIPRPCRSCYDAEKAKFFKIFDTLTLTQREATWERLDRLDKTPATLEEVRIENQN